MKQQFAIMVDLERCIGCKTCEAACKIENGVTAGRYRIMNVHIKPSGKRRLHFMTIPCMHCEKPACAASCPVNAIYKRANDGIVLINKDKCIGCRYCVHACPYGAINFDAENNVADKCTYCAHRLDRGEGPSCVSKCPGYALRFGKKQELLKIAKAEGRKLRSIDRFSLKPSTFYLERLRP
jgi:Fe-S-cluster-containing dehydrogenase component